jgi:hypothetical protein
LTLLVGLALWTCSGESRSPVGPGSGVLAPAGSGSTAWTQASANAHGVAAPDLSTLVSTCPGHPGNIDKQPMVIWPPHDGCVVIELSDGPPLTDDPTLIVGYKGGNIVSVQFYEQDVDGLEGIMYKSARVTLPVPVPFTGPGMTLHIHAENVPVYQLKGHTGGPIVRQAGTMDFGDIVYE